MQRKRRTCHYQHNGALSASHVAWDGDTWSSLPSFGAMASAERSLKPGPGAHGTGSSMIATAGEAKKASPPSFRRHPAMREIQDSWRCRQVRNKASATRILTPCSASAWPRHSLLGITCTGFVLRNRTAPRTTASQLLLSERLRAVGDRNLFPYSLIARLRNEKLSLTHAHRCELTSFPISGPWL